MAADGIPGNEATGIVVAGRRAGARMSAAALLMFLAGTALAQPTTPTADTAGSLPPTGTAPPLNMVDGNFLSQAVTDDQAQAAAAKIAQRRAGSDGVRQFAALLERDHAQLSQELQVLVRETGIQVPNTFSQQQQATESRLEASSGKAFDRNYLSWVAGAQQHSVDQYRQEADHSTNPQVKNYARQALPMLQAHLNRARQLQAGAS